MKNWCRFLPLAFVAWYARRNCQACMVNGRKGVQPFTDVFVCFPRSRGESR